MHAIEIVSHPLCPMAQRLVLIGLLADKAPIGITYLPYATLPQTARQHSETGELPVLLLDGAEVSAVTEHAAAYLCERFGLDLLPGDAGERLAVRTAERQVSAALDALRKVFTARDGASYDAAKGGFFGSLAALEGRMPDAAAGALSRMDLVALAPLATLTGAFAALRDDAAWQALPRLAAHAAAFRGDALVRASCCPDYAAEFDAFFALTASAFPQLSAATNSAG